MPVIPQLAAILKYCSSYCNFMRLSILQYYVIGNKSVLYFNVTWNL